MKLLLTILFIAVLLAILVMHVLSVRTQSRLICYMGIALHIVLFTLMLLLAVPMDLAVLVFMISVLWYSALSAARHILQRRMGKDGEKS